MKCINKAFVTIAVLLICSVNVTGCASLTFDAKYSVGSFSKENSVGTYPTYASDLCVANTDINTSELSLSENVSAGLFDLTKKETLFAQNVNERVMPASLTKVMTAYVALKYGSLDQMLVAGKDVYVNESGAQKINLKEGDRMTLDQALHILLIYSANDVANLIASNICGSLSEFIDLMNTEAQNIGATNSHFVNPHGLTSDEHYVTAYDMYLIFNAAMQFDTFNEIINMNSYTTSYLDSTGTAKEVEINTTNGFLNGNKSQPSGITVIGGKTGTTNAAGHCLILLARDTSGNPYIAVIMKDLDNGKLYDDMTELLNEIVN
ncbi:D-alanyl-D-alanine carboxypeptidase family protein [Butyrivibrio sp. YAB3001]|uniref:D-alanyl-D-alanine carboxypeptidase family protein n=1 Tax=Butyrivibrio sp. YAB3001 TaxID=1520812 RepID=UPI0008F667D8|nr:serine hydrolase [Butyrivibrio sp. YAB3001]SFB67844.1 D-alanyl-D-alanine carboxypeptidase [Butyrivibrio sp. YAB3001]